MLYFHSNKTIKEPETSSQSLALRQNHVRNICHTAHKYLTKFHFNSTKDSKEIRIRVPPLCSNAYDDVTDFGFWISQKHKNLVILRMKHYFFFKYKN